MQIWHYRPITGELVGPGVADPDPMDPGKWAIPGFATVVEPPGAIPEGYVAVFANGSWALVEDHRGEQWYRQNGDLYEIVSIAELGPIPSDLIEAPPPPPPRPLPEVAADMRWQKEVGGITVNGVNVLTDDRSKLMIIGARMKAVEDGNTTKQWKTPGGFVTLDAATLIAIGDAVEAHVQACFDKEAEVLALIDGGTIVTPEQVAAAFGDIVTAYNT